MSEQFPCEGNPHDCVTNNKKKIVECFREILELSGFDPNIPGMQRTPERQWEVLEIMTSGFKTDVTLDRMYEDYGNEEMASLRICPAIEFISICEHHFMPFYGTVDIAYVPKNNKVTGLSKLPQLVQKYALRPQLQEKMTDEIANELMTRCNLAGVMVVAKGYHTCEMIEGYRRDEPYITSRIKGLFMVNPVLEEKVLNYLALSKHE